MTAAESLFGARAPESEPAELSAQQQVMLAFEELAREQAAELARQNEVLRQRNEALVRANNAKGEFVAMVSHELRTPLNSVIGFSELLLTGVGGTLSAEQREFVEIIERSGRNLLGMINDLLDLAKLESGRMEFRKDAFDLREPVAEALRLAQPLIAQKHLQLTVEDGAEVMCLGDSQRVRQIALNLLSNAVKFTPERGTLRVATHAEGAHAVLCVRDSGIGIPPSHHQAIFEPFRQVEGASHRGTGLGLALVKRFAEGMGGTVSVDSRLHHGAVFTVRLHGLPAPHRLQP